MRSPERSFGFTLPGAMGNVNDNPGSGTLLSHRNALVPADSTGDHFRGLHDWAAFRMVSCKFGLPGVKN